MSDMEIVNLRNRITELEAMNADLADAVRSLVEFMMEDYNAAESPCPPLDRLLALPAVVEALKAQEV